MASRQPTTTSTTVASWIRGEAGSTVRVTVQAGIDGQPREVDIVRAEVAVETVSWAMVPGSNTAVLRLEQFSHGAADAFKAALGEIREAGADRVVFDLRGNPGGYVDEAVGVASQFLSERQRLHRTGCIRQGDGPPGLPRRRARRTCRSSCWSTEGRRAPPRSCQGRSRMRTEAELIGVTTYGTGTVLGEFALADGSALRVGTVEWLTPKGRRIWHEGIVPDVTVERGRRRPAAWCPTTCER